MAQVGREDSVAIISLLWVLLMLIPYHGTASTTE